MSRSFIDDSLASWEAYASGGPFGLPRPSKIVFQCLSDPDKRARFVDHGGDVADAGRVVLELSDEALRSLLETSTALD